MSTQSNTGRYRIGEHIVELRAPRLADATSWRQTSIEHEERLRPAFGSPHTDWDAEHSPAAWAEICRNVENDPRIRLSRVLTVEDGDADRVVAQQSFTGPDPRTRHAESSTWIAGLPNSKMVAVWMSAVNVLDLLTLNPEIRFVVTPQTTDNRPAMALAEAIGFSYLQTLGRLREFAGAPADHTVYALPNTAETRRGLEKVIGSIGAEPVPARRAPAPSPEALLGLARVTARKLRSRGAADAAGAPDLLPAVLRTDDGRDLAFRAEGGGRYAATVDGRPVGGLQVYVDPGTSTTELIERLQSDVPDDAGSAAVAAACRVLAQTQDTRRLTLALADRHALAESALTALGFVSEGGTLPTVGDESTPRATWTRFAE